MSVRKGHPARKPSQRTRWLVIVCGAALVATGAAVLVVSIHRGPLEDPALKEPAPVSLDSIAWPSVRPEAASAVGEARAGLERACALYDDGQRDAADALVVTSLGDLERAGALVPALGSYHYQTVRTVVARNELTEAERRALRWLEKFRDDFDHLFVLGKVRYQLRRWAKAAECFRSAARVHPESVEVQRWLAQTCAQMGAQDEAVQAARESLERIGYPLGDYWSHPLGRQVLGNAIMVLHRFQEYDLLAEVAKAYLKKYPGDGEAAMAEGVALANTGRYAEAEPLLRQARAEPGNVENADEIDFALGLTLAKQGKWAEAAAALIALLEVKPFYSKGYYQLGLAFVRLGRQTEADAMLAKSRELAPSEREMRREKEQRGAGQSGQAAAAASLGYSLRGEPRRAEQVLRTQDLQGDPYAVFALADLYIGSLRALEADNVIAHAAEIVGPVHQDVTGRGALAARARGETEKALAGLRAAASQESPDPLWKLALARTLLEEGRLDEAIAVLAPLRRGDSDREVSYLLGRALLEKGDAGKALEMLRSISTADTRWESWEGGTWIALALLEAFPGGSGSAQEAQGLLDAAPPHARSTRTYLRARIRLLERRGDAATELAEARAALRRFEESEPGIAALKRQISATPWPGSSSLRLALGRLFAARGETREAVRHARLALEAAPASIDALRALVEWLANDEDIFLRLKALRDLEKAAPQDASVQSQIQAIESRWLRAPRSARGAPR